MALNIDSEVFGSFAFYASILALKCLLMSFLTAMNRFKKGAFANPEDIVHDKKLKVVTNDPDVERVRRAHLNDLENILPFFTLGFLYCFTNPEFATANLIFKLFTGGRLLHTFVYAVVPLPQPSRALAWLVPMLINLYMGARIVCHYW